MLYSLPQLYPIVCTLIWAVLTAKLWPTILDLIFGFFSWQRLVFFVIGLTILCIIGSYLVISANSVDCWKDLSPKWPNLCQALHQHTSAGLQLGLKTFCVPHCRVSVLRVQHLSLVTVLNYNVSWTSLTYGIEIQSFKYYKTRNFGGP